MTLPAYGPKANTPHVPKPRRHLRRTFTANVVGKTDTVESVAGLVLDVRTGCWEVETDREGNHVTSARDERRRLWLTVGDHLIACPTDTSIDEVACVEVIYVAQNATRLHVAIIVGSLRLSTSLHIMPMRRKVRP